MARTLLVWHYFFVVVVTLASDSLLSLFSSTSPLFSSPSSFHPLSPLALGRRSLHSMCVRVAMFSFFCRRSCCRSSSLFPSFVPLSHIHVHSTSTLPVSCRAHTVCLLCECCCFFCCRVPETEAEAAAEASQGKKLYFASAAAAAAVTGSVIDPSIPSPMHMHPRKTENVLA